LQLKNLIEKLDVVELKGGLDLEISDIIYDSRKVIPGCLFVCLKGSSVDGHKFADEAIERGAEALLISDTIKSTKAVTVRVKDTRQSLALVSAAFFDNPAQKLKTIGITGTKGKTTCSFMIQSILEHSGLKAGIIGTLGVIFNNRTIKMENTTPESYEIQKYLKEMVDEGCDYAIMEASSLGLKQHRLDGFIFDYGIFTNFSSDHIGGNEHKNLEEYLQCKSILFQNCHTGVLNSDDKNFENVLEGSSCQVLTFGFSEKADFIAKDAELVSEPGKLCINFKLSGKKESDITVAIPGKFSVYNALAAIALCSQIVEVPEEAIIAGLLDVKVKGRVEIIPTPFPYTLIIDYAHNALSMANILNTLREYNPHNLIVLFGSGGNRPKVRRYEMGETAGRLADLSVITADNSRFESVLDIIEDILVGMKKTDGKYIVIPERREAIKFCLKNAQKGDIVILAGKGHEDYQEIEGVKYHFDEREEIASLLENNLK
jgi:UDP-N-acetylmuramoyl-L-alanyl-D-glutamate--2,6-diaminopimelate ligase